MTITFALTEHTLEAFYDSLEHLTGFFLVLLVLLLLWGVTALIGKAFIAAEAKKKVRAGSATGSAPTAQAPAQADTSPEEIAAIAAAISMLMGGRHRILSIRTPETSWGREGRRQHFASHKIR
ncbi:MAG: OadG family protein [Opitutales bacterium]|nr:OadG family protein [Opitutales bacterium]